jgi:hypothetical protein
MFFCWICNPVRSERDTNKLHDAVFLRRRQYAEIVKQCPTSCGTRGFITVFTRSHQRPIPSAMCVIHILHLSFSKIYFNFILPFTPKSSEWSLPFRLSNRKNNLVRISGLRPALYILRPSHSPWFDYPNNIWSSSVCCFWPCCHFIPLRSKYWCVLSSARGTVLRTRTKQQVQLYVVLSVSGFTFLDSRRQGRRFGTAYSNHYLDWISLFSHECNFDFLMYFRNYRTLSHFQGIY